MAAHPWSGRIVVGDSGSSEGDIAVDWAARRALDRGLGLTLFRVQSPFLVRRLEHRHVKGSAPGSLTPEQFMDARAHGLVDRFPGLDVNHVIKLGHPAQVLIRTSHEAALLTIGSRGAEGMKGRLNGGNMPEVVTFCRGPLAVIPVDAPGDVTGPVVVGVDDNPDRARMALTAGMEEAAANGAEMVILHAFRGRTAADEGSGVAALTTPADHERQIEAWLEPIAATHPEVSHRIEVSASMPVRLLTERSREASMVVVASAGGHGMSGWLRNSTSRKLAAATGCPVFVVR